MSSSWDAIGPERFTFGCCLGCSTPPALLPYGLRHRCPAPTSAFGGSGVTLIGQYHTGHSRHQCRHSPDSAPRPPDDDQLYDDLDRTAEPDSRDVLQQG